MVHLDAAIRAIDTLLEALRSGTLITGAAVQPPPKKAAAAAPPKAAADPAAAAAPTPVAGKAAKREKAKQEKPAKPAVAAAATDGDAFDKAQLLIGRVTCVSDHPSGSEKLWLCKVDLGSGQQRQVVAGLKQFIGRDELTGRLVAVVANLKPAKLAGELSEAMILAADHHQEGGGVLVRVLEVPAACQPGDAVVREGTQVAAEYPKECKSKVWKEVVEGLAVGGGVARFKGTPLVTGNGPLTVAADMPDGAGIH